MCHEDEWGRTGQDGNDSEVQKVLSAFLRWTQNFCCRSICSSCTIGRDTHWLGLGPKWESNFNRINDQNGLSLIQPNKCKHWNRTENECCTAIAMTRTIRWRKDDEVEQTTNGPHSVCVWEREGNEWNDFVVSWKSDSRDSKSRVIRKLSLGF